MTLTRRLERIPLPLGLALVAAGIIVGGLLAGYEPVGGDPDRMYRPLKSELARAYHEGRLPYWSDGLGLGVPLLAESHVAAFYPLNQVLYRLLDVPSAYRLAMWLHYLALMAATYSYARTLAVEPWGAALAGLAFTFCGFQAIHSSHEWAYHTLPYLPLALLVAERYLASGRLAWLPALALVWGAQLTIGHFQMQAWTGGLVVATGVWRVLVDRRPWWRAGLLLLALAWGIALAAVQLVPSWEFAQFTGAASRQSRDLLFYSFPPAHWVELAVPRLFLGLPGGPEDRYWFSQQTTGYEACLYIGTAPLILAVVGLIVAVRERPLRPWVILASLTFGLATLPRWWPQGYSLWLQLPVVGLFRCPARYTMLTCLGLCLLAGRGLDRAIASRPFWLGIALAVALGAGAAAMTFWLAQGTILRESLGPQGVTPSLGLAALAWSVSLVLIVAWRSGRLHPGVLLAATAIELGLLYYPATTEWGWAVRLPEASPVLKRLAELPDVQRVAGALGDLPLRVGRAPAYPYLGMAPELPNRLLEPRPLRPGGSPAVAPPWLRQFGVTHGVWEYPVATPGSETLFEGPDPALDRLVNHPPGAPQHATWRIVRYGDVYPPARVARLATLVPDERTLLEQLAATSTPDRVFHLLADRPPDDEPPRAISARIVAAIGRTLLIEHDGTCDLVLERAYYPGWSAVIDDTLSAPVVRAQAGLQAVRLPGRGTTKVVLQYRPTGLDFARATTLAALAGILLTLGVALLTKRRSA